jgi:hypothetical protein
MKKFIYKVLVYLLPVLLFFALPYGILEVSGELEHIVISQKIISSTKYLRENQKCLH